MIKKLLTLSFLCLAITLSAQQIEVPQQKYSLVTKRTATWCPHCGNWGWTLFENLLADNSSKALMIAAHYSGDLMNPTASAITSNFGGFGQPLFYLGNENQGVSSSNIDDKREEIKSKINDAFNSSPTAQTGMLLVNNGDQLDVYTKTRFFQNADGDYYVGVYLIEKTVMHYQSGQGQDADHKNVLRDHLTEDTFGKLISEGSISAGAESSFQVSYPLDGTYDLGNIRIATILWKKDGGSYKVVNTNFSDNFVEDVVATDEVSLTIADFSITPNPAVNQAEAVLELESGIDRAELTLFDSQGKTLQTLFAGYIPAGINRFQIIRAQINGGGLYLLQLRSDQKIVTRKVLFQ